MVSEFKLRSELAALELVPDAPLRRSRRILRLARKARTAMAVMLRLARQSVSAGECEQGVRFYQAARRLALCHEELRDRARNALRSQCEKLGFGYGPQAEAYPRWERPDQSEKVEVHP